MGNRSFYGNQHTKGDQPDYEYPELVDDIIALAEELGRPPTTRDAEGDSRLPSIGRLDKLLDGREWNQLLAEAGVDETQVGEYGDDECPAILRDIRRVLNEIAAEYLTVRQYDRRVAYHKSVVKRLFGTWSSACSHAGVPHGRKHGRPSTGPNGETLDSRLEVDIAQAIIANGLEYVPHKPVPGTRWVCDFYLPKGSYWVEVDGYSREQRPNQSSFEDKLSHYDRNGMNYAVVRTVTQLEEKVFQGNSPIAE